MTQERRNPAANGASSNAQNGSGSTSQLYRKSKRIDAKELKNRINTSEFYTRETGRLVLSSDGWHSALCPIHDDTKPSLRVLIPDGAFKCQACGAKGGDVIDFVRRKYGMAFREALEYLDRHHGGGS